MPDPFDCDPPRYIFGAGEMADHVIRLFESIGKPIDHIKLFDDGFPDRKAGPADLRIVANFADGMMRALTDRDPVMVATGSKNGAIRYSITSRLHDFGIPLRSAIHPAIAVGPNVRIGPHFVAMPGCIIGRNVEILRWCWLYSGVIVEHDCFIEENVIFGPGVVLAGHVHVCRHAFLGVGVRVAPGVTIGERCLIGAGAVVVRDIPDGMIAMGVPARVHRPVPEGADAPTLEALEAAGCAE